MNETKHMRLPSRIRKMSYRRQKVAMIRWFAARIELRISSFIGGSQLNDKLQATIAVASESAYKYADAMLYVRSRDDQIK